MYCDDSSRLRISITFAKMQQDMLSIEAMGQWLGIITMISALSDVRLFHVSK